MAVDSPPPLLPHPHPPLSQQSPTYSSENVNNGMYLQLSPPPPLLCTIQWQWHPRVKHCKLVFATHQTRVCFLAPLIKQTEFLYWPYLIIIKKIHLLLYMKFPLVTWNSADLCSLLIQSKTIKHTPHKSIHHPSVHTSCCIVHWHCVVVALRTHCSHANGVCSRTVIGFVLLAKIATAVHCTLTWSATWAPFKASVTWLCLLGWSREKVYTTFW